MKRGLQWLSVSTTLIMFIMLLMGALVTNTGSGMGCGASWPLCKGTFMPDWDYKAIIEFSHRAVSGVGGLMTLILAAWVWRVFPERPLIRWLSLTALFCVILQGGLGAAAVLWPQPKGVLALHFGISLVCFAGVLLVSTLLFTEEGTRPAPVPPALRRWVWWVVVFTYGVVYLGAYVRHLQATPACVGWPLCNGELVPTLYGPVGANFAHRVAAALAVVLVARTAWLVRRSAIGHPDLRRAADAALILILLQMISGAAFGLGYINLPTQMIHTALITLFWGAASYLCLRVLPTAHSSPVHRA